MRPAGYRGRRGCDAGALTLSYVIIVPVFLLAVMVIAQASLWFLARQAALAAARQGADAARVSGAPPGSGPGAALAFARSSASGYLLSPSANGAGSTASTVQIVVSGHVPTIVPGLVVTVTETAQAPVEKFAAP
jgi:Flp pilus assembly protein TadG